MSQNEELLFVMKLRDEASAVLKRHIAAVDEGAAAHDRAARQFTVFQRVLSAAGGGATTYGGAIRGVAANLASLGAPTGAAVLGARTLEEAYKASVVAGRLRPAAGRALGGWPDRSPARWAVCSAG